MKRIFPIILIIILVLVATSCSPSESAESQNSADAAGTQSLANENALVSSPAVSQDSQNQDDQNTTTNNPAEESSYMPRSESDTLVAYFSATGTTKGVAEKLAEVLGADTYEIAAAQEYTADDLNWNNSDSRTTHEQNDPEARPEIGSPSIDLNGYTTIYVGFPIWWGEEPRIMDTFVESYDFDGIIMIPFCTSGGSGIGRSGKNLAERAGSGNWLSGERLSANISDEDLLAWIGELQ